MYVMYVFFDVLKLKRTQELVRKMLGHIGVYNFPIDLANSCTSVDNIFIVSYGKGSLMFSSAPIACQNLNGLRLDMENVG